MLHYGSRQLIMLKFMLSYLAQPYFNTTKLKNGLSESVRLVLCTVHVHSASEAIVIFHDLFYKPLASYPVLLSSYSYMIISQPLLLATFCSEGGFSVSYLLDAEQENSVSPQGLCI